MFDIIGGYLIYRKGQYYFEVYNGWFRWFYRNEYVKEVFNVRILLFLQFNLWYYVVGMYDLCMYMVRVFVNGDLVREGYGSGMLFLDWEVKVGFGFYFGCRILFGYIDEIYIFRCVFLEKEIDRYLENLNRDFLF